MKPLFIAEVKTKSPFGFQATLPWEALIEIAIRAGDHIAVHTNPRWGGSFKLISKARKLTNKPILAKGIHPTDAHIQRALDAGADHVLVVGRLPNAYFERCWIEPRFLIDMKRMTSSTRVVWNTRDLRDGRHKIESWEEARRQWRGWMCQASNIRTLDDVDPRANAFLVGESMVEIAKQIERLN